MLESEAPDRRGVVVADLLLLGVEADALPDDVLRLAGGAPEGEGALEAHGQDALGFEFSRARAEGVPLTGGGVEGGAGAFEVGGDVAAHVEALHRGGG